MITIDPDGPQTASVQLQAQLASAIRAGELPAGARLPSVRHLAVDLGLSNGTVAKVYKALEQGGWVQTRRGGGTTVSEGLAVAPSLTAEVEALVHAARRSGVGLDEVVALVASSWRRAGGEEK
ncbi:GntR family transcriptional regulator [Galactobacter valiniphilus]|uniref:GntR family transcriptional regulator n=1 Tax=Galactobacter valiniphilus TaxID=2676122 RepID=UPI0037363D47